MLDILRRNASSVVIKIILGAIIVSFALFFGYSAARKSAKIGSGGQPIVATVDGHDVPASVFSYFYQDQIERMKESFKDKEMPEFIQSLAQNYALQRTVSREVLLLQAEKFGIVVPDEVLAYSIRETQSNEGQFDPVFYKQRFLPHFKNRYNLDFEQFLKEDLKIQMFQLMFASVGELAPSEIDESAKEKWEFEVIEVKPDMNADASAALKGDAKSFESAEKKFAASKKKVGPLTIEERASILPVGLSLEDYQSIFSLNSSSPIFPSLVESGGKFYAIKYLEKKSEKPAEKPASPADRENFFQSWMSKVFANAKVESHLPEDESSRTAGKQPSPAQPSENKAEEK